MVDARPAAPLLMLAGGIFSAVVGPETAIWSRDLSAPVASAVLWWRRQPLAEPRYAQS